MKKTIKLSKKLLGAALALGLGTTLTANAFSAPQPTTGVDELFSISEFPSHPTLLSNDDHECGEHECGEDSSGDDSSGEDISDSYNEGADSSDQ
jgi:hypothetical protein